MVLYFFLLRFKFLYAITPPTPNNFFINFGAFIFLLFIFISWLLLIASSGVIFLAFRAAERQEKYTVTKPNIADNKIGIIDILNTIFAFKMSPKISRTIITRINTAATPANIPNGIPIKLKIIPSCITLFRICLLVAPTLESIPYIFIFSIREIANAFFMQ